MSANGETPDPERDKRRLPVNERSALLNSLRALYTQISVKLWHRRMQPPEPSPLVGESADITGSLNGHIERVATEARVSSRLSPSADTPVAGTGAGPKKNRHLPAFRLFSDLSNRFKGKGGSTAYQRLGEKMRADTMRHLNKALRLAQQGDAQGAKVRAGLAENAMKTASQYLPEEEYRVFKQDVESRLKEIVEQ